MREYQKDNDYKALKGLIDSRTMTGRDIPDFGWTDLLCATGRGRSQIKSVCT